MTWLPIGVGVLLRLIQLWMPIVGIHSWRQADTAAMARHFAIANTPIWLPQIDWAGASAGYVESEFPLYPFLVSRLYLLAGVQEWLGRGLSVLFSVLTIGLVMRLGRRWFGAREGWWAGLFFAIAPLGVYYGRTFQAEALLLLLAAGCLVAHDLWKTQGARWALLLSWVCFTGAGLIKVIPLLWLGLPLLMLELSWDARDGAAEPKGLFNRLPTLLRSPGFWLYVGTGFAAIAAWYAHAYQLGQNSGLTFGFWGGGSDRSSLGLLLDLETWFNLSIRVALRLLAIAGVPFLIGGIWIGRRCSGGRIAISGLLGVLLCTLATMRSSSIHEYYQLPLLLFACPLMGLGWQRWQQQRRRWQPRSLICLWLVVSLAVLSADYWALEQRQARDWMPLALKIRRELPSDQRIVSVTSTDPTLLNLARRQGWLISSKQLTPERLQQWSEEGASHLAGSFRWDKMYRPMPEGRERSLRNMAATSPGAWVDDDSQTYLIPLDELSSRR